MSAQQSRLDLLINVFDITTQHALALPTLTPRALVAAILEEFRELEFLGENPDDYQLVQATNRAALDDEPLQRQIISGTQLALVERESPLPENAQRPSDYLYLRDQSSGKVYKLDWQPSVIGRPDSGQDNDLLAVNLAAQAGLRVSRRHAQIVERVGQYYVERLSENPTAVRDGKGTTAVNQWHPLHHGDIIILERSQIALKFIVRPRQATL